MKVFFLFLSVVLQVVPAMKDGLVADWSVVEALWDHALRYSLNSQINCMFSSFYPGIWDLGLLLRLLYLSIVCSKIFELRVPYTPSLLSVMDLVNR